MTSSTEISSAPGHKVGQGTEDANPMRKIIALVGIAIVVFLAFTTYSVHISFQSSDHLTEIKDLYFPVLERVDANIVRLDKMEEIYTQAVMIGERDMVADAEEHFNKADTAFEEMLARYPARKIDITRLRERFTDYKNAAAKAIGLMLDSSGPAAQEATRQMNGELKELRQQIQGFRTTSYENFVAVLAQSQQAVKLSLYMGLAIGLMNLAFMGVLVYFIRNNMRMMGVIAEQNASLERKVAERTAELSQKTNDINAMLNNMSLGVCTVVAGNRIHPEFSNYMRTIFGADELAHAPLMPTLFTHASMGIDVKDQIEVALSSIVGEDGMMFSFNGHLLPRETTLLTSDGHNKILQMDWSPILDEAGNVDKVLLIVQDVTHLRELELASAHQKEELDIIAQLIKISIGKFNDFVASAHKFIGANRELIHSRDKIDLDVVAALFRNMHTIKGNARTYEFRLITDAAHAAEQEYDKLRKDPEAVWNPNQMLTELNAVSHAIARYVEISEDKLGRKGRASDLLTTRGTFVANEEINNLQMLLDCMAGTAPDNLRQAVERLGKIPLQRLVSGAVDSMSSLAKELHKPTPEVALVDADVAFNNQFAEALKSSFMHIVRNSLDHGIEPPEERKAAGKPEAGKLTFSCVKKDGGMELHIGDDGRGLALHKLYEKGVASGKFASEASTPPQAIAELIFASGLSTATQVTQVSGRGVGMDAVRAFLGEQGADIRIELTEIRAPLGFTPFKFVIALPASAFKH